MSHKKPSSPEEEIEWALKPFGGLKVMRLQNPETGLYVWEARLEWGGAKLANGKQIIGRGGTLGEAVFGLWELLTERDGSYILMSGNQYKWKSGLFQQEMQIP